jgi:hypothetical protein
MPLRSRNCWKELVFCWNELEGPTGRKMPSPVPTPVMAPPAPPPAWPPPPALPPACSPPSSPNKGFTAGEDGDADVARFEGGGGVADEYGDVCGGAGREVPVCGACAGVCGEGVAGVEEETMLE